MHRKHCNELGMEMALLPLSVEKGARRSTVAHTLLSNNSALPCDSPTGREEFENTQVNSAVKLHFSNSDL